MNKAVINKVFIVVFKIIIPLLNRFRSNTKSKEKTAHQNANSSAKLNGFVLDIAKVTNFRQTNESFNTLLGAINTLVNVLMVPTYKVSLPQTPLFKTVSRDLTRLIYIKDK